MESGGRGGKKSIAWQPYDCESIGYYPTTQTKSIDMTLPKQEEEEEEEASSLSDCGREPKTPPFWR
jgi:hypothetical protein